MNYGYKKFYNIELWCVLKPRQVKTVKNAVLKCTLKSDVLMNLKDNICYFVELFLRLKKLFSLKSEKNKLSNKNRKRLKVKHFCKKVANFDDLDSNHRSLFYRYLCIIDSESLQNRLLKVCYVPDTNACLPRLSFFFFFCSGQ